MIIGIIPRFQHLVHNGNVNEGFKSLWYKHGHSVGGITDNAIYELYIISKQQ
jgi:hypothetical protein